MRSMSPVGFTVLRASASAARRLVCFPHAGASVSAFRLWPAAFGNDVEIAVVRLPGRYDRAGSDHFKSVTAAASAVAGAITATGRLPTTLFGHSLGALLAFEAARSLPRNAVNLLVVSGSVAPHLRHAEDPVAGLPDGEFLDRVRMLGATPEAVFANPEIAEAVLPTLRADFAMSEEYKFRPSPPLACPILALGGTADPWVSEQELLAWKAHTASDTWFEMFPDDHFFVNSQRAAVLARIRQAIERAGDSWHHARPPSRPPGRPAKGLSVVMTKGLPAAGKTTWARAEVAAQDDKPLRLSLDDLRQMFFDGRQSAENEEFVIAARDALMELALSRSRSVVVDATNLDPRHEESIRRIVDQYPSARFDIADFTSVPLETCVRRDYQRESPVGEAVIRDMYLNYIGPRLNSPMSPPRILRPDPGKTHVGVPRGDG